MSLCRAEDLAAEQEWHRNNTAAAPVERKPAPKPIASPAPWLDHEPEPEPVVNVEEQPVPAQEAKLDPVLNHASAPVSHETLYEAAIEEVDQLAGKDQADLDTVVEPEHQAIEEPFRATSISTLVSRASLPLVLRCAIPKGFTVPFLEAMKLRKSKRSSIQQLRLWTLLKSMRMPLKLILLTRNLLALQCPPRGAFTLVTAVRLAISSIMQFTLAPKKHLRYNTLLLPA